MTQDTLKETRLAALREALQSGTLRQAQRMVCTLHPAEIALLLESMPRPQRELVWELVGPDLEGDVLLELDGKPVAGLAEFAAILRGYAAGSNVNALRRRGEVTQLLKVELTAR
jgi:S1-C subfamily serine protease